MEDMGMSDKQWASYLHNMMRVLKGIMRLETKEEIIEELEDYVQELKEDSEKVD